MNSKLNREELAALELGHTAISRSLAKVILFAFLAIIFLVPGTQLLKGRGSSQGQTLQSSFVSLIRGMNSDAESGASFIAAVEQRNTNMLRAIDSFEGELEEGSFLRDMFLAPGQRLLLRLGYGNEKVYPGKKPWLFYRPDMDYLMGPPFLDPHQLAKRSEGGKMWEKAVQPDPVAAILAFRDELAKQGVALILMPTPIKASIQPEMFSGSPSSIPLQNRSWQTFVQRLQDAGIMLFDSAPLLMDYKRQHKAAPYLETDTHWTSKAMAMVAEKLAIYLKDMVPLNPSETTYKRQGSTVRNRGDIDAMLQLPESMDVYPKEEQAIDSIVTKGQELWQPERDAEILLLGDSFSNIYSLSGMGWGQGAGFGEQLSYFLQRPLDMILQNDGGSHATRELLSRELARGRDRLAGKKLVIWQFANRELSSGNWRDVAMELKTCPQSDFYIPASGESRNVQATIVAVSRSPIAGSVPYKDNIITLHLDDIKDMETGESYGQALVYAWGMKDNVMLPLSGKRAGDEVSMRLNDWDMVQGQYSSYRRSTLDDEMLELELPVWGEILP